MCFVSFALTLATGGHSGVSFLRVHEAGAATGTPYIGVCLGAKGAKSRILNRRFTPVNHPVMATAAPGQLSAAQLMAHRQELGLISPKKFYLFGHPIQQSLSPRMHNGAFKVRVCVLVSMCACVSARMRIACRYAWRSPMS